jgi:type III restriction enzyme
LNPYRKSLRFQQPVFDMAAELTRDYICSALMRSSGKVLSPQIRATVERYLRVKVRPAKPAEILDVALSP